MSTYILLRPTFATLWYMYIDLPRRSPHYCEEVEQEDGEEEAEAEEMKKKKGEEEQKRESKKEEEDKEEEGRWGG